MPMSEGPAAMSCPAEWSDLGSILASADGKACLYGYLRAMDSGDPSPRRFYKHIELLDEVALFRREADDAQRRAERIVSLYVTPKTSPGGLYAAAPTAEQLKQADISADQFEPLEDAAREALKPFVTQFLSDVKKGEKTVRQRVKESGYLAFSEQLNGGKKKAHVCALC
ncbi:hypothetical protein FJT64_011796 [Amphibalanus amphitrite]|uniref:Uncharacterized protein n=1 Tax=Amphibalanus amphitrite TaxID=1232801 RepID=A0A6A4V8A3_AMPAM|nr:hypothetical protein FJT64_011796 [Amphibalanus amphitrite]